MLITGIVLAAGSGSRFDESGRQYKLTETLSDGRSVVGAASQALLSHVDRLVVVGGARGHEIAMQVERLQGDGAGRPILYVQCTDAALGMGASIKAGVAASIDADAWLIALGDMPAVSQDTIAALCRALASGALIARPYYQGKPGHPVGLSASLCDELLAIPDATGAASLIRQHHDSMVRLDVSDPGCIFDIDYPEDLNRYRQHSV